jgi:hypothetical protein
MIKAWWSETKRDWQRTKSAVGMTHWDCKGDCPEPTLKDWLWHARSVGLIFLRDPWVCRLSPLAERKSGNLFLNDWGYEDWNGKPNFAVFIDFYDCYFFVVHIGKFWYECSYL